MSDWIDHKWKQLEAAALLLGSARLQQVAQASVEEPAANVELRVLAINLLEDELCRCAVAYAAALCDAADG